MIWVYFTDLEGCVTAATRNDITAGLPCVISLASYSEKVTNDLSKLLVFYSINNIVQTLKQNIFIIEKGSRLKMLYSVDHMVMGRSSSQLN